MSFPTSLTEEEVELKSMFEILKRVKKLAQSVKVVVAGAVKTDSESAKAPKKRNLDEIAGATEEAKRLVKAGAMTISKVEEKQTFKRSKQLDRKLKEGDRDTTLKYQPFTQATHGADCEEPGRGPRQRVPALYDSFVVGGEAAGEARVQKGTTIYVRGFDLMEDPLRKAFSDFGSIVRVHVEERRRSAFVEFASNEEADRAIKEMNGNMLNGITLRVTMARRQNYVLRHEEARQSAPDSWASIASGRGAAKEGGAGREEARDVVSYDDADEY